MIAKPRGHPSRLLICIITLSTVTGLSCSISIAWFATPTPTDAPTPTEAPTPTAIPTEIPTPTIIPRAVAATRVRVSPTPSCTPWWDISLASVGARMCVYGDVSRTYDDGEAYLIAFSSSPDAFYLVSYDVYFPDLGPGDCIRAVGRIDHLGNTPVMTIGWTTQVTDCY